MTQSISSCRLTPHADLTALVQSGLAEGYLFLAQLTEEDSRGERSGHDAVLIGAGDQTREGASFYRAGGFAEVYGPAATHNPTLEPA